MRSFGAVFGCGFISTARNFGGRPYRRMLSTNRRTAQMWIHALNACARGDWRHTRLHSQPGRLLVYILRLQATSSDREHTTLGSETGDAHVNMSCRTSP